MWPDRLHNDTQCITSYAGLSTPPALARCIHLLLRDLRAAGFVHVAALCAATGNL